MPKRKLSPLAVRQEMPKKSVLRSMSSGLHGQRFDLAGESADAAPEPGLLQKDAVGVGDVVDGQVPVVLDEPRALR
jgi:hypothetical protein